MTEPLLRLRSFNTFWGICVIQSPDRVYTFLKLLVMSLLIQSWSRDWMWEIDRGSKSWVTRLCKSNMRNENAQYFFIFALFSVLGSFPEGKPTTEPRKGTFYTSLVGLRAFKFWMFSINNLLKWNLWMVVDKSEGHRASASKFNWFWSTLAANPKAFPEIKHLFYHAELLNFHAQGIH